MKEKIKIKWSCSDYCHIEHKYKWISVIHGRWVWLKSRINIFWMKVRFKYPVAINFNTLIGIKSGGRNISATRLLNI